MKYLDEDNMEDLMNIFFFRSSFDAFPHRDIEANNLKFKRQMAWVKREFMHGLNGVPVKFSQETYTT
jgi:hypothetical protein